MSGIINSAGSRSGVIYPSFINQDLGTSDEVNFESYLGGDYSLTAVSTAWSVFANTTQISSLDAGYWYIGDSHLSGWSATYSASYFFNSSYLGTGGSANDDEAGALTFITKGSNFFVQISGGYIQVKQTASDATYTIYTKVRKMFKNI